MTTAYSSVSRELVPFEINGVSTIIEKPGQLSKEQKELCVSLFGKPVPKEDIDMFFGQAEHFGLSPFSAGQIWGIPRTVAGKTRLITQIGVNGLVLIAERTGKYLGMTDPEWCRVRRLPGSDEPDPDAPEVWRGAWMFSGPPDAARVGVWRRGAPLPMRMTANFSEYAEYTADGWVGVFDAQGKPVLKADGKQRMQPAGRRLTEMWQRMPANQLAKCAAALALRRCFQQEFSGLRAAVSMADLTVQSAPRVAELYGEADEEPRLFAGAAPQQLEAPERSPDLYAEVPSTKREATPDPTQPQPRMTQATVIAATPATQSAMVPRMTDPQRRLLFPLAAQKLGWGEDDLRRYVVMAYRHEHISDLTVAEASALIEAIKGDQVDPAAGFAVPPDEDAVCPHCEALVVEGSCQRCGWQAGDRLPGDTAPAPAQGA